MNIAMDSAMAAVNMGFVATMASAAVRPLTNLLILWIRILLCNNGLTSSFGHLTLLTLLLFLLLLHFLQLVFLQLPSHQLVLLFKADFSLSSCSFKQSCPSCKALGGETSLMTSETSLLASEALFCDIAVNKLLRNPPF